MNDRDALRYAARRAAFGRALREGDALGAARAGARLRLFDAAIAPREFLRARDARRALGRAIVGARRPKPASSPERHESAITAPRGRDHRRALVALALLALLALLIPLGAPQQGGGGTPQAAAAEQQRSALLTVSRGRTVGAPAEIVVVAETTPSPTPAPSEEASPSPAATSGAAASSVPGASGASGSTGPGGSGGGAGGGNGTGQGPGNGSGTSTPTPLPAITLGPVPPGFARLVIIVLDAQTRRPLPDVCVVIGTATCAPGQPHTDVNGRWAADVASSSNITYWDVSLIKTGYTSVSRRLSLRAGSGSTTYSLTLRRRG